MNELYQQLCNANYVADKSLCFSLQMMNSVNRPLLIEGEAGVGKTAVAQALAKAQSTELIRLQCYEGLDAQSAVYEWNYAKQLMWINIQQKQQDAATLDHVFSREFLLERPLLKAITQSKAPVLLIDEIDRADEAFEAYLLELLSEFQVSIPEYGTITATTEPSVILTSNASRELSDALRRRCLYHYLDFPDKVRESEIINASMPDINEKLTSQIVQFIQLLRKQDLVKRPGIAETLDWSAALLNMKVNDLTEAVDQVLHSLGCVLKTSDDRQHINQEKVSQLLAAVR